MLSAKNKLPRHSISIELTEENWDLLDRIPTILREENCLDTADTEKVTNWRDPEELKVSKRWSLPEFELKDFCFCRKRLTSLLVNHYHWATRRSKRYVDRSCSIPLKQVILIFITNFSQVCVHRRWGLLGSRKHWIQVSCCNYRFCVSNHLNVMVLGSYTYEIAPVFILMEETVMKYVLDRIGFSNGDGLFCPGGSISNMFGLTSAR